jgi:sugar-specific transcriptional regulator TrmB
MHKVEVYRVLKELEKMGAVERVITHPIRYRAKRPEEVFRNLLIPKAEQLANLDYLKAEILGWFDSLVLPEPEVGHGDDFFVLLRGKPVLKMAVEMIDRASGEILSMSQALFERTKPSVQDSFERAVERGAGCRAIINLSERDADKVKKEYSKSQVLLRHSDKVYSRMLIVDRREMLFGTAPTILPDEEYLYTKNQRFIKHAAKMFEKFFEDSIPLEDRIQELEALKLSQRISITE